MRSDDFEFDIGDLVKISGPQSGQWAYAIGKIATVVRSRVANSGRIIYDLDLPEPPGWYAFAGKQLGWQTFEENDLRALNGMEKAVRRL